MNDTRTLEQVIFDASSSYDMTKHGTRSQAIAESVREWMKEILVASCAKEWEAQHQFRALQEHGLDEEFPYGVDAIQHVAEALLAARAEVERLKAMTYLPSNEAIDKVAKYDVLRERFPYLPGDEFWTYLQGAIRKWSVCEVWIGGEEILCKGVANGKQSPVYRMHECHPTADACRAAIPVEEGEKN